MLWQSIVIRKRKVQSPFYVSEKTNDLVQVFFYQKNFYKKMSLKNPKNLKKVLRQSPASDA